LATLSLFFLFRVVWLLRSQKLKLLPKKLILRGTLTSTMRCFSAIALNNLAIQHLEQSEFKQAAQVLSQGLSVIRVEIACLDNHDDEKIEDANDVSRLTSCFHKKSQKPKVTSAKKYEDQVTDNKPFVFQYPISITDNAIEEDVSYGDLIELSFIQLYNLALCHHSSAFSSSHSVSAFQNRLQKALSLYELAYAITINEDFQPTALQTMAIVNNIGHIHSALGHTDCASQCFENLLSTIMFVKDCGEQDSIEQGLDGFLSNALAFMNKDCTLPAAA
jgi:tetratricopeptide (TPR) repeat protein